MLTLDELYIVAEMQAVALQATLETISRLEAGARGTSPTIGCSLSKMYEFEATQTAEYCRKSRTRGVEMAHQPN